MAILVRIFLTTNKKSKNHKYCQVLDIECFIASGQNMSMYHSKQSQRKKKIHGVADNHGP